MNTTVSLPYHIVLCIALQNKNDSFKHVRLTHMSKWYFKIVTYKLSCPHTLLTNIIGNYNARSHEIHIIPCRR